MRHIARGAEAAIRDLEERTLASVGGNIPKLVYLASTRDYNTGVYQHEGLERCFSTDCARQALRSCHNDAFSAVTFTGLSALVEELVAYFAQCGEPRQVLDSWRRLQAYRVLVPVDCDPLSRDLFISNIRVALEVVSRAEDRHPSDPRSAQPRP